MKPFNPLDRDGLLAASRNNPETDWRTPLAVIAACFGALILAGLFFRSATTAVVVAHDGDLHTIHSTSGFWPCGSTKDALDELTRWVVLKNKPEMLAVMGETGSFGLTDGLQVRILETGMFSTRVRVVDPDDPRAGRACWVDNEALALR